MIFVMHVVVVLIFLPLTAVALQCLGFIVVILVIVSNDIVVTAIVVVVAIQSVVVAAY